MRIAVRLSALVLGAASLPAQSVETSLDIGMRTPIGGELVVPVPVAATVGYRSEPRTFGETNGTVVGATARLRLTGTLSLTTGVSATFSNRFSESPGITVCRSCASTMVSGLVGVAARRRLGRRLRIEGGVGGELIHLGGAAYSKPLDVLATADVVPTRRVVGGANVSIGTRLDLRRGGAVRFDVQGRRYHITSRWTDPGFEVVAGAIKSTPYSDVRLTVGWAPRARP